jgi:hypothetical protein
MTNSMSKRRQKNFFLYSFIVELFVTQALAFIVSFFMLTTGNMEQKHQKCLLPLRRVHGFKRTYPAPRIHGLFIT